MDRLTTRIVPPEGPLDARLLFIGEAPGFEEGQSGRPFHGMSGRLLTRAMGEVGLGRQEVLIHNVFSQQPPNNNINYYFQDAKNTIPTQEGLEHIQGLKAWLTRLKERRDGGLGGPFLICALGAIPMRILTGKRRINKWRGSILPCTLVPGFLVYPTFHPSYVNRLMTEVREGYSSKTASPTAKKLQENVLPLFIIDLSRVKYIRDIEIPSPTERTFEINLSRDEILTRLHALEEKKDGYISIDIETFQSPDGPILWCVGFGNNSNHAFVIPFIRRFGHAWSDTEEASILQAISRVLLNSNLRKIFHNGTYDLSILGRYYGLRVADGTFEDTMWLHHASYPYIRKALEVVTSIYTWEPYYKDEGKVHFAKRSNDTGEFLYNCKDCTVTSEIFPFAYQKALELGTLEGYYRSMSFMPSILGMMLKGVRVDIKAKDQMAIEFRQKAAYHEGLVRQIGGADCNPSSPTSLVGLLYGKLGLPIQYHYKTKKVTTDKDALQKLHRKFPDLPVLTSIIEFRKFSKLAATYAEMEVDSDERIHTSYGFISTWRLSSSESHFGSGGNLQNIPNSRTEEGRAIRKLFVPDVGKVFVSADYKQAEAMVVAWEAEDLELIDRFEAGEDVHWFNAQLIFGIPSSRKYIPTDTFQDRLTGEEHPLKIFRHLAKTIVHACNYGMGPVMLQTILAREGFIFELATCRTFLATYKNKRPMLTKWQQNIRNQVQSERLLISSYGRKREFKARLDESLYQSAYAFSPQNTVGEMLEQAIQNIWDNLPWVEPLLNVHDEVICQVPIGREMEAIQAIEPQMLQPIEIKGRTLTIPLEFKIGPSWGELEEVK